MEIEKLHGNITLGAINEMLISFIGKDAFVKLCNSYHTSWQLEWQSEDAFKKLIQRICKEDSQSDLSILSRKNGHSFYALIFNKILPTFQENYGLSSTLSTVIQHITDTLYTEFVEKKFPIHETNNYYREILFSGFLQLLKTDPGFFPKEGWKDGLTLSRQKCLSAINLIRASYQSIRHFGEKMYETGNDTSVSPDSIKRKLDAIRKGTMPRWDNFSQILDFITNDSSVKSTQRKEIAGALMDAFILSNIESFFRDKAQIPDREFQTYNTFCRQAVVDSLKIPEIQSDELSSKDDEQSRQIENVCRAVFKEHKYLENEQQIEHLITELQKNIPQAKEFHSAWMRGYIEVAKGNFEDAKKLYKKAFEARRFAGGQFKEFIKQAVALSMFQNSNPDAIRNSMDPQKESKSPLPNDARTYWDYGYAAGVMDEESTGGMALQASADTRQNFYLTFTPTMFYPKVSIPSQKSTSSISITPTSSIKKDYEMLLRISNKKINQRVTSFYQTQLKGKKLPPLTLAIFHAASSNDPLAEEFISLANKWLNDFPSLNVNTISDNGSTPACDAIQQYKISRQQKSRRTKKLKEIALDIVERTSTCYIRIESRRFRSPLQEAIEAWDLDIVKAIVEKEGMNINGLVIAPDKVSPVYYALIRITILKHPEILRQQMEQHTENINFSMLNLPGLTIEDKKNQYEKLREELYFRNFDLQREFGIHETYSEQLRALKEICLYLIEHTNDQDEFIFKAQNLSLSSLYFAKEIDDVDICRALLNKGANPNLGLPTSQDKISNNFLTSCIISQSWCVLEMFLQEFPEQAKEVIEEEEHSERTTSYDYFINCSLEQRMDICFIERIKKLFIACGTKSHNDNTIQLIH